MDEKLYVVIAGIIFLLIAVGHVLRVIAGVPFVVYDVPVPMWASLVVAGILAFLSYEGFHLARKSPPRA
jgi:hypothetical protein